MVVGAPRDGIFFERFQALGLRVVEFPPSRLSLRHLLLAIRLIRQFDIAIVHTHGKGPGLYGRLAAWWTGTPAVHTFHGIHYANYSRIGRWLYLALERRLSRWVGEGLEQRSAAPWKLGLRLDERGHGDSPPTVALERGLRSVKCVLS